MWIGLETSSPSLKLSESKLDVKTIQKSPLKITVEPPVEEADIEQPIDEDLEDNNTEANLDKNKKYEGKTNKEKWTTGTGSSHSLQSSKSTGGNSNQSSKQKVLNYLQQLQEPITIGQSYNLLQEVEMMDDEDEMENILSVEENIAEEEEVIFSPQFASNVVMEKQDNPKPNSKWGPVQA
jgi:hypothetical protein